MHTTVIVEGSTALSGETPDVRFVGVDRADVVEAARRAVRAGTDRIELCGGLGPVPQSETLDAVGADVPVGAVMYGFESLESTVDYKRRFAAGEELPGAFLYLRPGADPRAERADRGTTAFVPVPDEASVGTVVADLADEGVRLIELYGGLGAHAARAALSRVAGRVAVGLALYPATMAG